MSKKNIYLVLSALALLETTTFCPSWPKCPANPNGSLQRKPQFTKSATSANINWDINHTAEWEPADISTSQAAARVNHLRQDVITCCNANKEAKEALKKLQTSVFASTNYLNQLNPKAFQNEVVKLLLHNDSFATPICELRKSIVEIARSDNDFFKNIGLALRTSNEATAVSLAKKFADQVINPHPIHPFPLAPIPAVHLLELQKIATTIFYNLTGYRLTIEKGIIGIIDETTNRHQTIDIAGDSDLKNQSLQGMMLSRIANFCRSITFGKWNLIDNQPVKFSLDEIKVFVGIFVLNFFSQNPKFLTAEFERKTNDILQSINNFLLEKRLLQTRGLGLLKKLYNEIIVPHYCNTVLQEPVLEISPSLPILKKIETKSREIKKSAINYSNNSIDNFVNILSHKIDELRKDNLIKSKKSWLTSFAKTSTNHFYKNQKSEEGFYPFLPLEKIDNSGRLGLYLILNETKGQSFYKFGILFLNNSDHLKTETQQQHMWARTSFKAHYLGTDPSFVNSSVESIVEMDQNEDIDNYLQKLKDIFEILRNNQDLFENEKLNFSLPQIKTLFEVILNSFNTVPQRLALSKDQSCENQVLRELQQRLTESSWPRLS